MRQIEILGYGSYLPQQAVHFGDQTRYRVTDDETQLSMAVVACQRALAKAGLMIEEIDCIVSASAVGIQPIPCTAALIHEQIAQQTNIPALDINTTCTSFISALDTMSYLIEAGRYQRVLIVSSEVGSLGLNPNQQESYELFSDGAAAFIFGCTNEEQTGVITSMQRTWSQGAHATEIRGGLTNYHPKHYADTTKEEFMFDMNGHQILSLSAKKMPKMFKEFLELAQIEVSDIDYAIPHQASRAMPLIMKKLQFKPEQYANYVSTHGNMVSASIPYTLCQALNNGDVKKGDTVLLIGTAAGLTVNMLYMRI